MDPVVASSGAIGTIATALATVLTATPVAVVVAAIIGSAAQRAG